MEEGNSGCGSWEETDRWVKRKEALGGGHILWLSISIQGNGMTHGTELSKERLHSSWNEGQ